MKRLNRGRFALIATAMAATSAFASIPQSQAFVPTFRGMPTLVITRVEQIDNLDQGDMFGKNNADFFAIVTVNGMRTVTPVDSHDDAAPYWQIPLDMRTRYSHVTIQVMDDDGGLERHDDHADVNPLPYHKDVEFWYDRWTGEVRGDVNGSLNQRFVLRGAGDDDLARLTFMVYKG